MAQECGFFNAKKVGSEYDRVYLAEQFAAYFASFIGNGVFGGSMQGLEVVAQDTPDMSIRVLSGEAWINGWWYRNKDSYTMNLQVADGVLSRIDAVVVRWGNVERDMWLEVLTGVPSESPKVPSLIRNADYYDIMLGYINVDAGSIKITQAQITDTRLDNEVCGLVTGVVDQIDTTDLYNQFTSYFNNFKQVSEAEFDKWSKEQIADYEKWSAEQKKIFIDWFQGVQSVLDGDVALNLQNQISRVEQQMSIFHSELQDQMEEFQSQIKETLISFENDMKDFKQYYEEYFDKLFFVGDKSQLAEKLEELPVGTVTFLMDDNNVEK